ASWPATIRALCAAYGTRMPSSQHFSHATAALLHGLPLPARLERDPRIHVTALAPGAPPRVRGVVGHRAEVGHPLVVRHGMRLVSPADAWCQLSTELGIDELVAVGDALLRRQNPLATPADLDESVHRFGRRRGARRLREARGLVRAGVD